MTSPNRSVVVRLALDPSSYVAGASRAEASTLSLDRAVSKVGPSSATSMEQAAKGAGTAEGAMGRLNKTAGALGFTLGGLAGVGGAIAAALSVKWAGDYQQALTKLATTAGESQKNLGRVGQGMLDMAGQVGIGADELAKGMYTVESGGFHGANALNVLKAAAQGARQEQADLTHVTDAVTTALHDYHLPASDAAKVTSQLITAVSHGKTTFDELTGSLHSVTPIASGAGISLADVTGSLSAMTAAGMSADQASQNLGATITYLAKGSTGPARAELAQFGIDAQKLANNLGKTGISGALQEISTAIMQHMGPAGTVMLDTFNKSQTAAADLQTMIGAMPPTLAKMSTGLLEGSVSLKDYRTAAKDLGGQSGAMAMQFLALMQSSQGFNQMLKTGGPDIQNYIGALARATGTQDGMRTALMLTGENAAATNLAIKDIAATSAQADGSIHGWAEVQGNFNQQLAQTEAHAKSLAIEAGQHLLPVLTGALGYVNRDIIPGIEHLGSAVGDAAHWFGELPAPVKDTALALGALALANKVGIFGALESGAGKLVSTLGSLASGAKGTVTSLSGLKAAGTGLMNFFGGPMVLGVAGVTAAFVASSGEIDDWAKGLEQGGKAAQDAFQQLQDAHNRSILDAHSVGDAWGIVKGAFADGLAQIEGYSSAQDKATQKAQDFYNALSPTQKLQQNLTVDQNDLNTAVDQYGRGSEEAKFAVWRLNLALGDQQTHQQDVDGAIRGTNGALQAQLGLQQQLSQAGLSLDQAQLSAKQSIDEYKKSLKDANLTDDARQQILDDVQQSIFGVMHAAQQKADLETKGLPQQLITNQEIVRQRDALNQVVQQLGFVPPALQSMYDSLNGPTAKSLQAAQTNVNNMGSAMTTVTQQDAPGLKKALDDLATAAGTTFPLAVTGGFLPAAKGAGDTALITAGHVGQAASNVDGLVRSLLGVPTGTATSDKALGVSNGWFGTVSGAVSNLTNWIKGIPAVNIKADASQANTTIDAFMQKVQTQGFVGAIFNINPLPHKATGGMIEGPGSGTSDSILGLDHRGIPTARVSAGEFIVNAAQTAKNRPLLEGINAGLIGLAGGGYVLPASLTYLLDAGPGLMATIRQQAQAAAATAFAPGAPTNVLGNAAIVQSMAAARGWTGAEWNALYALVMRESGFRNTAQNPTSTAYGMFQFLNSTWAGYGLGKTSDPRAQTRAGLDYIGGRYHDPLGAWAHETRFGWYDGGGALMPGATLALNGTGRPETVRTDEQEQTVQRALRTREFGGSGGVGMVVHNNTKNVSYTVPAPGPTTDQTVRALRDFQYQQDFLNG